MKIYKNKYVPYPPVLLADRQWPNKQILTAPVWCSVDLRDGNQALETPMNPIEKKNFFDMLIKIGFKEIEIGFPSASQTEYDFARLLIDTHSIPSDVTIQVITPAREDLIKRSIEAVKGAPNVIMHLYLSTSSIHRKIVFKKNQKEIIDWAIQGINWIKKYGEELEVPLKLEFTLESFTGTELEYSAEICNAVIETWGTNKERKVIINLPSTVELSTPNIYADRIEWLHRNLNQRENIILSLHTHNDRGCAIAATELGLMAGADRVEGTLLGNGERAGNVDILNLALNLYTQGIDPELDLSNLPGICRIVQECTKMEISKRHPYAGQLIFTAFSGSHQDAVNKGFENQHDKDNDSLWEMPYIPIDPCDIGRSNVQIIRITSQSGKGGTAYVVKHALGYELPKMMHADFAKYIQKLTEETGREVTEQQIVNEFQQIYLGRKRPFEFISYQRIQNQNDISINIVLIKYKGKCLKIQINESDTFETYIKSLNCEGILLEFISEQSLPHGSCHEFVSYTKLKDKINGKMSFGVGIDATISIASIKAIMSGLNNLDN